MASEQAYTIDSSIGKFIRHGN